MKQKVRGSILFSVAALFLGGMVLQASTIVSEKFDLPFAFHIGKNSRVLPAGEYRVRREPNSPLAVLTNLKTGERAQVMSSQNTHETGKTKLVFANENNGISLKDIL